MQTKLSKRKGRIALIQVEPGKLDRDSNVLAAMTQDEGTDCWQLCDVRLAQHIRPSPYSAEASAEHFHSTHTPKDEAEAAFFKARLREYLEDADGTLHWCTYEGIVRGSPTVDGYAPPWRAYDPAGYFSEEEGLAALKDIQAAWEAFEGNPAAFKIENPLRQPTTTQLSGELFLQKILAEREARQIKQDAVPPEAPYSDGPGF